MRLKNLMAMAGLSLGLLAGGAAWADMPVQSDGFNNVWHAARP